MVKSVSSSVQKADALDSRDCGHSQAYFTPVAGLLYSSRGLTLQQKIRLHHGPGLAPLLHGARWLP